MPNLEFQVQAYAGRIRALSIVWFIYGGLSLAFSVAGLFFANAFLRGNFGPWAHEPWAPHFFGPPLIHLFWGFLIVRSALAFIAGWGLMERAPWGRVVAIVAAIFSLLKIPIGTALGIWTLVSLLGYRNTTLYDQL